MMRTLTFVSFVLILLNGCQAAKKAPEAKASEPAAPVISNMKQMTFEGRRAGEGYFRKDGKYLSFQSEREPGNPFYQIYLMDVKTGATKRISPGPGKTTCSWIHPTQDKVLFSSTHEDPELKKKAEEEWEERRNPKKRYNWSFDDTYEIYEADFNGKHLKNLTRSKGYDAEASYSPDGRWIAFASNRRAYDGSMNEEQKKRFAVDPSYMMDIFIMRADGTHVKQLTNSPGYDGGPFFSPDGKRIAFRRFSEDGARAEVYTMNLDGGDQKQITRLNAMSWAPFYHPSGDYLIFTTNKQGYHNFELYIVDTEGKRDPVRVTDLPGFDGLPVFSPDGSTMVWAHTNEKGEAQLFRADWNDRVARKALGLAPAAPRLASSSQEWIEYLASEKFEGRMTGSEQEKEYTETLARAFAEAGLKPVAGRSMIQTYEFPSGVELGAKNELRFQLGAREVKPVLSQDWIPLSYSQSGPVKKSGLVFAGYGLVAGESNGQPAYDSYGDLDVKGKWAVIFAGIPEDVPQERRFQLHVYSRLQHKAMMARQKGAAGLIVVDDSNAPAAEMNLKFDGRTDDAGIPVLRLSPATADQLFGAARISRAEWTKKLSRGDVATAALPSLTASADVDLKFVKSGARNVLAELKVPGAQSTVVVGAHLDHLGHGVAGSSLSKEKNAIHYGADDNASGVAGVLETARALSERVKSGELKLKRNVIFALWTGEEIGILGSNAFLKTYPKVKSISAYVNMDMIGRMRDVLLVQGVASAPEWKGLVERVNSKSSLTVRTTEDPYLPSDALAFYMKQIPVVMLFTGSHPEYHTEKDVPALINYKGVDQIAAWAADMTSLLASGEKVTYRKVESHKAPGEGRGFRLYLGTIPDYSSETKNGVLISGTSKGSPAENSGLQAGDVIQELGGMKIKSLQDYVYCLQALKANQKVAMKVLRAGVEKNLEITPVLRSQQ
jgi:Tol biopolymer transport system component